MAFAYHAMIGTEEIRLPESEVDTFRAAALAAARDGATWVPIRITPTRTVDVLVGPYSTVRIETIDIGDDARELADDTDLI